MDNMKSIFGWRAVFENYSIKDFFKQNAFFGIPEENILFFVQGELPLVRENGSKVTDAYGNEVYAANGNGGIFKALEDEGILFHMQENHVEYICSCNVDNILVNPFDEIAIGVLKENNAELGIKSVAKANAEEKVGNIVLKDGKTTVVEYIDMPIELAKEQIRIVFEQAQKEVDDLHQRTSEGLVTAKLNGKQIGQPKGAKLTTKKSIAAKEIIKKYSQDFDGSLEDADVIKLAGISRNSYYKYKREIREEIAGV